MLRSVLAGGLVLGCLASVSQAAFFGVENFDNGTTGPLTKEIDVSTHQSYQVGNFGGPGQSFNYYHSNPTGGFQSTFLLADTSGTGAGDVYGDVTVQALYKPSISFEFAVSARVQQYPPNPAPPENPNGSASSGWGVWATQGTQGFAPGINIAVELQAGGDGQVRASNTAWGNGDTIVISASKWYDVIFKVEGLTATATVTELDGAFAPVAGHTATVSYTDTLGEMQLTGFVGTRGAQMSSDPNGYLLDNFSITAVPEPASLSLLALGGLAMLRRRRSN